MISEISTLKRDLLFYIHNQINGFPIHFTSTSSRKWVPVYKRKNETLGQVLYSV